MDMELASWTRPEDEATTRPSFTVATPAADVLGQTSAALSAVSLAFSARDAAYAAAALAAARQLYSMATAAEGLYSDNFPPNQKVGEPSLVPIFVPASACAHLQNKNRAV